MARPVIAVALPSDERTAVHDQLTKAGFEPVAVANAAELGALLGRRRDVAVAFLDGLGDLEACLEMYALLHENGRHIPALTVVSAKTMERLAQAPSSSVDDEYVTRPYSPEAVRWQIEAMCIRSQTIDDGSGPVLQGGDVEVAAWESRGQIVAIFNPKGGVGKTTIATNLAAALQVLKKQQVLLVDADSVTGHVTTSLGVEQVRTAADSWLDEADGGPREALTDIASTHPTGIRVVALSSSPMQGEVLDPKRVADALHQASRGSDFTIVDLHPSYTDLNLAIFEKASRILVPVTPDVPAIRAAVQLRDVATELGIQGKLALVVNRANSGVSVADMERTVGMPALAQIRSGGLHFVRAANEGRTVIELFPKDKLSEDFVALADRLMGTAPEPKPKEERAPRLNLFGRQRQTVRT